MWVVVIKKMDSDKPALVLRRSTLRSVISHLNKMTQTRKLVDWSDQMLAFLKENYGGMKACELAARLAEMSHQEVSANAVIGKANLLGLCRRRTREPVERGF